MLLVIDIGNTNTVLGVYQGESLRHHWRIQTHRNSTSDEWGILFRQLFAIDELNVSDIKAAIISCVVPPVERSIAQMIEFYIGTKPAIVGKTIDVNIPILIDEPTSVGADRLVNAVAAWEKYKTSLVVVDFGTATTFDAISKNGEYLGGAIAPGIGISSEALFLKTSKLPRVEFSKPDHIIGKTTVEAIKSGLLYGYVGLVNELVKRFKNELSSPTTVVATGGLASFINKETDKLDYVDPLLTLEGLRLIWNSKNKN